jgi:hypothetical protein
MIGTAEKAAIPVNKKPAINPVVNKPQMIRAELPEVSFFCCCPFVQSSHARHGDMQPELRVHELLISFLCLC